MTSVTINGDHNPCWKMTHLSAALKIYAGRKPKTCKSQAWGNVLKSLKFEKQYSLRQKGRNSVKEQV
jgi:hypothetical protein